MSVRRQEGFTLLEILVALAIFAVAISSIMSLLLVASSSHKRAVDNTRAAMLAESVMSTLSGEVRLGNVLKAAQGNKHANYPGMHYDVLLEDLGYAANVTVVVHWKREGKKRERRFSTVILGRAQ